MVISEKNRFGTTLHVLYPGDYHATRKNCLLVTVVGSSVVVCMYDKKRGIGGMGHFIVPGAMGTEGIISDEIARIGIVNMEYLMGEIVKLGGNRKDLKAKIFGSGYSGRDKKRISGVVSGNIRFLHEYFNFEKIEVEKEELGGEFRRKIYFSPKVGVAYRKILKNNGDASEFITLEKEYIDIVFRKKSEVGEVILF